MVEPLPSNMFRLVTFALVALCLFTNFVVLAVPLAAYYAWRYVGYELFVIGVLVDGYYGLFYDVPIFSMITTVIVLLVNMLAPYVLVYNERT